MDRRRFLQYGAAAVAASAMPVPAFAQGVARPNILFIPFDDLKPLMACYGVRDLITPNFDRLAARGAVFLNNMCQQAVCGPTRASLMTGMYPDYTGIYDMNGTKMRDVNPDIVSLPQYLVSKGYETTGIGKTYDPRCVDKKNDEPSWSIPYGSTPLVYNEKTGAPMGGYHDPATKAAMAKGHADPKVKETKAGSERNVILAKIAGERAAPATECMDVPDDAYADGALAKAGCELLEKLSAAGKPFFLSVGFLKPHLPFVAPRKYWDLYDRARISIHPFQQHAKNSPEIAYHTSGELRSYSDIPDVGDLTEAQQKELIHGYRAAVSYVDAQLGKLLDKLEALSLTSKTLVCLWGDHGWHLGDHGLWCKHSNFENAARAPLIMAGPGIPAGLRTSSPTGFVDIFPTLCDLAGVGVPGHLHGKSLAPLFKDSGASVREAVLSQYPRQIDGKPVMGYALRDRRYRYVKWIQCPFRDKVFTGPLVARELYDYEKDPDETVSQADNTDFRPVVERFEAIFKAMNVAQHTGLYASAAAAATVAGFGGVILNGDGKFCAWKTVPVSGQPFAEAHEVRVLAKPESVSGAAYKRPVRIALAAGKTYRVVFSVRHAEAPATFTAILQTSSAPFKKLATQAVTTTPEWTRVELTLTPGENFEAEKTVLTCHCGSAVQAFLIADVRIRE